MPDADRLCVNCGRLLMGTWPADDLRRAFVAGAQWWQFERGGATMYPFERAQAEREAVRRYGEDKPATG